MPDFQTQECEGFFEHWQSLPKDGLAPTAETFLDQAHPAYAPMIYVLEHADTDLIVRLMGTELVERWGMDRTGKKQSSMKTQRCVMLFPEQPSHRSCALWNARH